MAFLDGKYEITAEHVIAEQETQLDAVAPDGSALRIICYELKNAEEENHFERYRQVLKRLKKQNLAAVYDIVSRPGTHYVAWHSIGKKRRADLNEGMKSMLERYGFGQHRVDIRFYKSKPVMYDLAFHASEAALEALTEHDLEAVKEPETPTRKVRDSRGIPSAFWSWLLSGFLLLLAGLFFLLDLNLQANTKLVVVPDLRGQDINVASQELQRLKLKSSVQEVSSQELKGTVVAMTPEPGTRLRPFYRTVQLDYALPAEQFALKLVPRLRGETYSSVRTQAMLEQVGLRLGDVAFIHSNNPRGLIIGQSVEAGRQLEDAEKVDILVSQGPESPKTFLPNLQGLDLQDALYLAELAGFDSPDISYQPSLRYPEGAVIAQSIPANLDFALNSSGLRLTVAGAGSVVNPNESEELLRVPSFVGLSREEAIRLAATANYNLRFEEVDTANLIAGVIDQSPDPDTLLNGSELVLLVNVYTPPVLIPVPEPSAYVQPPQLRSLDFSFFIEQGIPLTTAEVYARTADGREALALPAQQVKGGEMLVGSYRTTAPGSVTFILRLNGDDYSSLRVNP